MKISFESRLILFFIFIFIGISILGIVASRTNHSAIATSKQITHTKEVIAQSEVVFSLSKDIVTGSLRYVITGDSSLMDYFLFSKNIIFNYFQKLDELTKDDPTQQIRNDSLKMLLQKRIEISERYVKLRNEKGGGQAAKLIATGEGKFYTDETRRLINEMQDHENHLLRQREEANDRSISSFNFYFYLLLSSVLLFLAFIFFYTLRNFRKRARAEQDLRQTNHFLDTILENIPNMIFVKDAAELRFVRFNKAGEELLGYSRKDLIGKNDYDFFPLDQAEFFTNKDRDVINKGKLLDIPEEPINTASGGRILHTKKIPIRNEEGKPVYLLGISEDITEQKEADQRLKDLNERFMKIFNISPVAMSISDIETASIMQVNDTFEKLFLIKKEDIIGKSFAELKIMTAKERKDRVQHIQNEGGHVRGMEMKLRKTNGEMVDILTSIEVIEIENRNCLLSAAIDITERKKSEEEIVHLNAELEKNIGQLRMVNTELEAFTYSVSHDLRAPLRIINGYAEILNEDCKDKMDDEARKNLGVIKSSAAKMGQLIDDLLNFSRLGRKELMMQTINMDLMVKEVLREQQIIYPGRAIEIKTAPLLPAVCDSDLIRQVWANLISNAIKYSGKKERTIIEIGAEKKDKEIIYFVKDNGVGFDMQYAGKLFGVFQRLHKMTEFEGTGVGLAIVQRIVIKHHGRVWAEGEENKGATFYFSLPV